MFFASSLLVGPRRPSPAASQPVPRWSYVKLVKAVAVYWHIVRGIRAVSEEGRSPLMGAFRAGIKKARPHATREKASCCFRICGVLPILPTCC